MTRLIGGDSLARNSLGGLNNPFCLQAQAMNRAAFLNEFLFEDFSTNNEWKQNRSFTMIPSGYPPWQSMLPINRLQQLSLKTKDSPGEKWRSLQGIYPPLFPTISILNTPIVNLISPVTQPTSATREKKSSYANQSYILPKYTKGVTKSRKENRVKNTEGQSHFESHVTHIINNLELSVPKADGPSIEKVQPWTPPSPKLGSRDIVPQNQQSSNYKQNKDKASGLHQESRNLVTRKRSSSWPSDTHLNKKKFVERVQDDTTSQSYKNLEIDVANILVSDIPIAVVGLNAPKDDTVPLVGGIEKEIGQQSSDSAVDVDSDGSSHSERENCPKKPAAKVLFTCTQCAVTFESTEDLISHTSSHTTNNFTFTCNVCSQVFRSTNGLQKHVEFHADDEHQYHCSFCFQLFSNKSGLEEHIINTHMSKRPHKCTYCPKAFRDPGSLQKHVRIHTGEKPYQCTACVKSFAEYSSLRKHFRVHTGEQPYKCKFCPKAFSISGNLQRHILIHTGERPYKCSDCNKAFNNPSHLRRHIKNLHSKLENEK